MEGDINLVKKANEQRVNKFLKISSDGRIVLSHINNFNTQQVTDMNGHV